MVAGGFWWLPGGEAELKAAHNVTPGLAVILVGSRKDSQSYARTPSPREEGMNKKFLNIGSFSGH